MLLGKKQLISNDDWIAAMGTIEETVSKSEIDALTEKTVTEIQRHVSDMKSSYAWSGGKDSIVLGHICESAGITDSMIGVCNLEYPAFMRWIEENKPNGCKIINTGQNIEWLAKHLVMLFPQNSATAGRWFSIVQHTAQRRYFKAHNLDILLLGRRRADGNFVGRGGNIYTDDKGVTRYSPLADWRHEDILAYIHYHALPLPPIYSWHNGYKCGTHPWPARQYTPDITGGWGEIYEIDRDIVIKAAALIPSAAVFLEANT